MNWISVKDRLPEESGHYLLWEKYYSNSTHKACLGYYNAFFVKFETNIAEDFSDVTHWMPLPEPPDLDERLEVILEGFEGVMP